MCGLLMKDHEVVDETDGQDGGAAKGSWTLATNTSIRQTRAFGNISFVGPGQDYIQRTPVRGGNTL